MIQIEVYEPPMCCSSGVCGPEVDPRLAAFAADVDWLASQGVNVARHNLRERHAIRLAWIPWYAEPPVGPDRLLPFAQGTAPAADSPTLA